MNSKKSTELKVRKPRTPKSSSSRDVVPLDKAVVARKEEPEEPVVQEVSLREELEKMLAESPVVVEALKKPPEVTLIPKARVVVKCASYKVRGRSYTQGQTFTVEGSENIQKFRNAEFFEVYDLYP